MKVLVLGGAGLQGKAVVHDLSRSSLVKEVVCADLLLEPLLNFRNFYDTSKVKLQTLDARNRGALVSLMKNRVDVIIDVLPAGFMDAVIDAALEAKVSIVNTKYGHTLPEGSHERALEKNITILPESGLDPGIDLVLCGYGVSQMDEVHELHSYCGGFPEPGAADNPLKYKVTWTWNGVLLSYKRPARMMRNGKTIEIPARDQHAEQWIKTIEFPGVGKLELIPNGDALIFADYLGILKTLRGASRCSMRWPGHSAFWKKLADLNFLSDEPVKGLAGGEITPHQFMVKHLGPQLQYREGERDMVAMRNVIIGTRGGKEKKIIYDMLDMRDTETGLFAMNRTVGYTASIAAQMIVKGQIRGKGVLTAVRDIPPLPFMGELSKRGIIIQGIIEPAEPAFG